MKNVDWSLPIKWSYEEDYEQEEIVPVKYLFTNSAGYDWAYPKSHRHVLCIGGDVLVFSDDYGNLCWHDANANKPILRVIN